MWDPMGLGLGKMVVFFKYFFTDTHSCHDGVSISQNGSMIHMNARF